MSRIVRHAPVSRRRRSGVWLASSTVTTVNDVDSVNRRASMTTLPPVTSMTSMTHGAAVGDKRNVNLRRRRWGRGW